MRKQQAKQKLLASRHYWDNVLNQVGNRWDTQVYSDGLQWTVIQVVRHVADADLGHNRQLMNIAEGNDIIPADFDIERYNKRVTEKTAEKTVEQCRENMNNQRTELLTWLDDLDESKLDSKGRHASLRILSVEEIIDVLANHERDHAQDIARVLDINV
jgi:hypothetical protein